MASAPMFPNFMSSTLGINFNLLKSEIEIEQVCSEFESVGGQKFFENKALRYREIK
jgi:hypothetical protein